MLQRLLLAAYMVLMAGAARAQEAPAELKIDAKFPGGNIIVEKIEGDVVHVRPDLRDTSGGWFYWCFRVTGAAGRTLTFNFTQQKPVGVRGPAVSLDGAKTWSWAGIPKGETAQFQYAFAKDAKEVYFGFAMTYTQVHFDAFLKKIGDHPAVKVEQLCETRKGRAVERLRLGRLDGQPRFRVLVTARHHACEMMANYALEGIIESLVADDATGKWFRENVEMLMVPFIDKDGVEDGDQGKNRKPRDHNRDYSDPSVHVETAAMRAFVPKWSQGKLVLSLDVHCPHIRGTNNEVIYQVGRQEPAMWKEQQRFGQLWEKQQTGALVYAQKNDVPFGTAWNTAGNYAQGVSSSRWAASIPGVRLSTGIELPYANASGKEVTQDSARALGRDLATAVKAYLEEEPAK